MIQLWLGPLILLTSVSLVLTMLIGSAVAVIISVVLELIQALPLDIEKGIVSLQLAHSTLWQTNLPILLSAALLIIAAVLYYYHADFFNRPSAGICGALTFLNTLR